MKKKQKTETLMGEQYEAKRNITPAMAVKILKKSNVDITEERAKEVLDLLYVLARLTVRQFIKDQQDGNGV